MGQQDDGGDGEVADLNFWADGAEHKEPSAAGSLIALACRGWKENPAGADALSGVSPRGWGPRRSSWISTAVVAGEVVAAGHRVVCWG